MHQGKLRASALLSALFIMTLVAIAATAITTRLQLDIYRTRMTIANDNLYLASQAVAFWAMGQVTTKKTLPNAIDNDGRLINYPRQFSNIYPGVEIEGSLYDLQARFNLNNLDNKTSREIFSTLIKNALPKVNKKKRAYIVRATAHWITPYSIEHGQDDLASTYLEQKPPYQPSHQPMQSVSEFRLIAGVTPEIYDSISPYLTTLPTNTKININTAPKELLKTLTTSLSDAEVDEIIQTRADGPILKLDDINELLKRLNIKIEDITLESEYFLSVAKVKNADIDLINYTVIKLTKDKKISAKILTETLNTF